MKKLLCNIVVIAIFVGIFPVQAFSMSEGISYEEFSSKLTEMILKYEGASLSSSIIEEDPLRLIVKTEKDEKLQDYYDAVCVVEGYRGLHVLQYLTDEQLEFAYNSLAFDDIEYVDKDFYFDLSESSVQQYENNSNHLSWNSETAEVDMAWELIKNSNVDLSEITVAVFDSGIYANHDRFASTGRIVDSGHFHDVKSIDDEGNEIITSYSSMDDLHYHGTHVSGILFDNSLSNVKIKPYKVTNTSKVLYSTLCNTIEDAVNNHIEDEENHIDIMNISIAGDSDDPNYGWLYSCIDYAVDSDIVVVVCAGNESKLTNNVYPACNPKAITVAATTQQNSPAHFSNFGKAVDISAPGTDIYSTVPRLLTDKDLYAPSRSEYFSDSGTSQAAPLVSAAAAMIKSIDPDITPAEVERIIKETAYVPEDWEESCGGKNYGTGIVNFYNIAKAMLGEGKSAAPTIKINANNKFEITASDGTEPRIYYTIDGTAPTMENHLTYTEPLALINTYATKITAVCHENGKLIGEPVTYDMITYENENIFLNYSEKLSLTDGQKSLNWSSYNPNTVSVDNKGNITANSIGDATVICLLQTGERVIWNVKVRYTPIQAFLALFFFGFLWL